MKDPRSREENHALQENHPSPKLAAMVTVQQYAHTHLHDQTLALVMQSLWCAIATARVSFGPDDDLLFFILFF